MSDWIPAPETTDSLKTRRLHGFTISRARDKVQVISGRDFGLVPVGDVESVVAAMREAAGLT